MKLKSGFVLHTMGSENVVVPVGERTKEFNGMIKLNSSSAFLWGFMKEEFTPETLADKLCESYGISKDTAAEDVSRFIEILSRAGILEE